MSTAMPRPNWTPGGSTEDLAAWYTNERRLNPNIQIPNGYSVGSDGTVTRDQPSFLMRNPWLIPVLGVGAGLGGSAIAGTGLFSGSGAAGAAGAATVPSEASIPTTMGIGSGAGTSAATGSVLSRTMQALAGAAPIVGSLTRGSGGNSLGSNISQVMQAVPQLGQLMDLQLGQAQRADPLHQSLIQLSQRLLPNSAR